MSDKYDKDKSYPENWMGRTAARHFIIWIILWILIEFAIVTWIFFTFTWGEEGAPLTAGYTSIGIASSLIMK